MFSNQVNNSRQNIHYPIVFIKSFTNQTHHSHVGLSDLPHSHIAMLRINIENKCQQMLFIHINIYTCLLYFPLLFSELVWFCLSLVTLLLRFIFGYFYLHFFVTIFSSVSPSNQICYILLFVSAYYTMRYFSIQDIMPWCFALMYVNVRYQIAWNWSYRQL